MLTLLAVLAAASAHAPVRAHRPGASPSIACETSPIVADDDFMWHATLTLSNPGRVPLTVDSARVALEDRGEGETRVGRTTELPLPGVSREAGTLTPGTSRTLPWTAPATIEQGLATFELDARDPAGKTHVVATSVAIAPSDFSVRHPSEFLEVEGRRVEVVFLAAPDSTRPAPGLLLVHGHAHHARQMLRTARRLQRMGFAVMLLSQPGYGRSEGPADFMGPHTMAAASAAFDRLARSPGVDATRLGAWGVSRGATVVALLMTRRTDVRAGVAQAGVYDMWAAYRGTELEGIRANMLAEAGADSASWRERSPVEWADRLTGKLLIMHGEDDANVPFGQAKGFFERLQSRGAAVEAEFFPAATHALPRDQASMRAIEFLRAALAPVEANR